MCVCSVSVFGVCVFGVCVRCVFGVCVRCVRSVGMFGACSFGVYVRCMCSVDVFGGCVRCVFGGRRAGGGAREGSALSEAVPVGVPRGWRRVLFFLFLVLVLRSERRAGLLFPEREARDAARWRRTRGSFVKKRRPLPPPRKAAPTHWQLTSGVYRRGGGRPSAPQDESKTNSGNERVGFG